MRIIDKKYETQAPLSTTIPIPGNENTNTKEMKEIGKWRGKILKKMHI